MRKRLELTLSQVPNPHPDLCDASGDALGAIDVEIKQLCHHLCLDTYGRSRGLATPHFEIVSQLISDGKWLRFNKGGAGSHKEARVGEHTKYGKAFCRWFLYRFMDITFFTHMDDLLDRRVTIDDTDLSIQRIMDGDTPDYVCSTIHGNVCLAEAKGTRASINITNARFDAWREQFTRVQVMDGAGNARSVKGYIVATRLADDRHTASIHSRLVCEDPKSPGREELQGEGAHHLHRAAVAGHYSDVLDKLRLGLLGESLRAGFVLPDSVQIPVPVWECLLPEFRKLQFVGRPMPFERLFDFPFPDVSSVETYMVDPEPLFFGLAFDVFNSVRNVSRDGRTAVDQLKGVEWDDSTGPVSTLRDGTMCAPLSFMRFQGFILT